MALWRPICVGALMSAAGCGSHSAQGGVDAGQSICSQMHRAFSQWQGTEISECGPDVTSLIELTPIGNHEILARRRFSSPYDVWTVDAQGAVSPQPTPVEPPDGAMTAGFAFLPGAPPRVLVYDPRSPTWTLYLSVPSPAPGSNSLASPQIGSWPQGDAFASGNGEPAGHQFVGLENGALLDRNLSDGSSRIWQFVPASDGTTSLVLVPNLAGGPREALRRGHRLSHLGPGRMLEWLPHICNVAALPAGGACAGADYNIWSYTLDASAPRDPFDASPVSTGTWTDVGAGQDMFADDVNLFVWTRASGDLQSYTLDPSAADPRARPFHDLLTDQLSSRDWEPPTQAPGIKNLVLILQNGRSFDSYFGAYCQGNATGGVALACDESTGCDPMPLSVAGAASCAPLDPATDTHVPASSPACLRAKIDNGAMDGFALAPPSGLCGDPLDFACAAAGPSAGALAGYDSLAESGALADRFFQTYGYATNQAGVALDGDPTLENLLYLVAARFGDPSLLADTPLLTKELARNDVPWAVYAGPTNLPQFALFGVPLFYDPDWYPFRSLESGELEHDIAVGTLPSVAVVVPDGDDPARSEAPGHPFAAAIDYVNGLVDSIASSPIYGGDTLVLLTYLTAGGYYDHVAPPPPPPLTVDGSSSDPAQSGPIWYGPRVPLLAAAPFGRAGQVSHVQLELSSLTVFIDWNWLHGSSLKGVRESTDRRQYRDAVDNNIGSLIDPVAAGIDVPCGHD